MRLVIAVLLIFSLPVFAEEFGSLTVQEVSSRLKEKNFFVFDNNNYERFQKGHVPGAKWVNPYAMAAKDLPADKSATLVFYCANEH
jgi:hypothetical protein